MPRSPARMPARTSAEPATLYDAALAHARQQWAHREKELKAMRASLALLEPLLPALKAKGCHLPLSHLFWRGGDRELSISPCFTSETEALFTALLQLGFMETRRSQGPGYFDVHLKQGRLRLVLCVYPRARPTLGAPATATATATATEPLPEPSPA